MLSLERASAPRRVGWLSLLGLVLIPLLVAGGFLWATWNSDTRLDRVQAAIVNDDEPVRLNGELVPLGRQLAGGLVTGGDDVAADENFDWVLTDDADAKAGLANGRYAAVVWIPQDFSARATSFAKSEAADIKPADITVETSKIKGIADSAVAQTIATQARAALNTQLTEQYLDNVYIGFNTTKKQFDSVAKGAREFADGTGDLSDALDQTSDGTKQLADGLDQLDDGARQLSSGTGQLSTGAGQLAAGLQRLAEGTKELPGQTRKLANGAQKSADGADDLADGVGQYVGGVKQLDKQLPQFTDGLAQTADGAKQLARGSDQFSDGLSSYANGQETFVSKGLQRYADGLAKGSSQVPRNFLRQQLEQPGSCPFEPDQNACRAYLLGVGVGAGVARAGLNDPNPSQPGILSSAKRLSSGARQLSSNYAKINTGLSGLGDGLTQLDTGAGKIEDGVDQLAENGTKLASGTSQLATGLGRLADGTDQLATGLRPLSRGIAQTATGASELSTGVSQLATGTTELATGTSQSADGARKLSDGMIKLDEGGTKLADGSDELATGLEKGAKEIPTYDETTRTKLAEVVATPVTADRPTSLFADIANVTFLAAIALWLGGLASFVVLRATPAGVLTSMKPSWQLALGSFLPAAAIATVQAIALTVVLQVLLELDAGQVTQLLPFLLLAGLAFTALNQGLVAWLGGIGRFISVAVVVLSAAGAITSAVPAVFDAITPFLPITPALAGARAIASNGNGAVGAVALLLAWLIVGAVASVLAVARHRMAPVGAPVPAT